MLPIVTLDPSDTLPARRPKRPAANRAAPHHRASAAICEIPRQLATERTNSINKASSAMRARSPRFGASAHHSATSSRARRAASGTYCGTFAQVS